MALSKEEALKKINESESVNEFEVFATDEHKTYIDNYAKQETEKAVKDQMRDLLNKVDEQVINATGMQREQSEKTTDFLNRVLTDSSSKVKKVSEYEAKVAELQEAIKNNTGDDQLKSELKAVREQYENEKKQFSTEKAEYETKMQTIQKSHELDKAMIGFEFNSDLPKDLIDTFIENKKNELLGKSKIVDGKLIFIDENGNTLVNKNNALNPYTAKELLEKSFESIVKKDKHVDGAPKVNKKDVNGKQVVELSNIGFNNKAEVTAYLRENAPRVGIPIGGEKYMKMYQEFSEGLPLE